MSFAVPVGGIRGDQMANPAEGSTGTNPKSWGHDQPEDPTEKCAVIDLAHAGNNQAEHSGGTWFFQLVLKSSTF